MKFEKKIKIAKTTNWLSEGLENADIKKIKELALISSKIEMKRIDLEMSQKQFADMMGVSQGMVSKWESGDYNFTITTLNDICEKLELDFEPKINSNQYYNENNFEVIKINLDNYKIALKGWDTIKLSNRREGIA